MANHQSDHLPTLPGTANLAFFRRDDGDLIYASYLPRWLTSSLGLEHELPMKLENGHPLRPLASIAADLIDTGLPLDNFLIELTAANGDLLALLIQGRYAPRGDEYVPQWGPQRGAVLALRDVTEVIRTRRKAAAIGAFHGLVGQSLPMLEVYHKIATYGPTEAPVIITGETGTGKELVARALHDRSNREQGPYVAVNCVALSPELFESELFGHEKGSFTGAMRTHRGRFQRADGGTLFLDEIGDMPMNTQAKMLRALEDGTVEKVGSEESEKVDVRVLAATNVALEQAVAYRRFRADLFHRLSVLRIHVPALRERDEDLPMLAESFLEIFNERYGKSIRRITPEALRMMKDYHWPGNVRELRNVMERLVIETNTEAIGAKALLRWMDERDYFQPGGWNADSLSSTRDPIVTDPGLWAARETARREGVEPPRAGGQFWGQSTGFPSLPHIPPLQENIIEASILSPEHRKREEESSVPVELTRDSIQEAYNKSRGNLTGAARKLGVHKATLYRHMKQLDISREDLEEGRKLKESD